MDAVKEVLEKIQGLKPDEIRSRLEALERERESLRTLLRASLRGRQPSPDGKGGADD